MIDELEGSAREFCDTLLLVAIPGTASANLASFVYDFRKDSKDSYMWSKESEDLSSEYPSFAYNGRDSNECIDEIALDALDE
jgi:hypothetical protein